MKVIILCASLICWNLCAAQDLAFTRKMVDTLTSANFWGRGYTREGMRKTADFLAAEFQSYGLKPMKGNSFFQDFSYPVNTFPDRIDVKLNGKNLVAGKDFIVNPESAGGKVTGRLVPKDSMSFITSDKKVVVYLKDKLTWSVAPKAADHIAIQVDKNSVDSRPSKIRLNISQRMLPDFKASNVCAIVPGTQKPDSTIVISAHYDHLGGMGKKTYFPGANDNASGVSLLLSLAKYYSQNPQPYSMAFILFGGEEAGLIGSRYYTENPLIPLEKIRFLINLDMVGTGDAGITVVNGLQYPDHFSKLTMLNDQNKYLSRIAARGKAANSDHYWFTEKGVPAFFIYTSGGIRAYHDIFDIAATLPLNEYEDLFRLIVKFNDELMN